MAITGGWTDYAKAQALGFATDVAPGSPPILYAAIFTDSANPHDGTNTELAVLDYARLACVMAPGGTLLMASSADLSWALAESVTVGGIGIMDALTVGHIWFYFNNAAPVLVPAGLLIPAGGLVVGAIP